MARATSTGFFNPYAGAIAGDRVVYVTKDGRKIKGTVADPVGLPRAMSGKYSKKVVDNYNPAMQIMILSETGELLTPPRLRVHRERVASPLPQFSVCTKKGTAAVASLPQVNEFRIDATRICTRS